ncbi:uncharacterized protein LOC106129948 [Amyelois transitella]|uniref:uncharacterized protein LOC106129948 n=1 Tax=Amyelois transitella TaxID=680683 RepID=UPI00067BA807|nr:uncharacterized protein LOC106129948 [Amyelois transitella]
MASEYDRKFEEMKNYVPFLESMIKRLENTSGSTNPRQAQLDKIRSLRDLLLDKKKRMKMENLLKCEQVLVNLYAKVEQRDTLPGIDLKVPSSQVVTIKEEPDLDVVRNKLKIVTKMQANLPDTLPEIARANDAQETSTAGAKEPALFQRRPNITGSTQIPSSEISQPKRNYTRVLVSPEPSSQRWSKQSDMSPEKPLFSRRSPRRQSPTHHRKDRKQSKQRNSSKSNLNITLKVPEESLDSLNTSDIFSRIINCSDNDVDIATLRELRSQILGELKHTGAKEDISDLILNSSRKKKKKKSQKKKEEVEEGELSDSESEAIENIYGSLVILDKDHNASEKTKASNKQEQKPRKIQIRLVINSENDTAGTDTPNISDKKSLVSDLSDVSELEIFDCNNELETKSITAKKEDDAERIQLKDLAINLDEEIAPKASELLDDQTLQISEKVEKAVLANSSESNEKKETIMLEVDNKTEVKKNKDNMQFKPNFYKPLNEHEPDSKEVKCSSVKICKDDKKSLSNEKKSGESLHEKKTLLENTTKDIIDLPKQACDDVQIPLLNEPAVVPNKSQESAVSEIDILQALKNEILSDSIAIPVSDQVTPALHQPKLTKVANTQEIGPKKRISIENYKQKSSAKSVTKPLFTTQSSSKDDQSKKQSLKLTEKECERFKFALSNDLSSDDDDIFDDLNKSDEDEGVDLAPKSPDDKESSKIEMNTPVIIPIEPIKNAIESSKADVDMRTLLPLVSPVASTIPPVKDALTPETLFSAKQNITKMDINRPSDPRLKKDSAPTNVRNESFSQSVISGSSLLGYPNITSTLPIVPGLIPTLTPSPNMTPNLAQVMTPTSMPNMTPIRAPSMTPIVTPNSRSFEIDDQPGRKHVYASLYDTVDYAEDTQRLPWEKFEKVNSRDSRWEPATERECKDNKEGQQYNRYSDSRDLYPYNKIDRDDYTGNKLDSQIPTFGRSDASLTPSHPFGRSDCPPTPSHSFGRSDCPPTPSHPFGRSDCPPTPSHHFRSECPPTPSHPFGRKDCPPMPNHHFGISDSGHSYSRSECPRTPSHPFGRSDCPTTPSHSFGRSECPTTPTHSFGRSEMPMTPIHPFGRVDPRLQKSNEYDSHTLNDDRTHRYFKDQSSFQPSYNVNKHDVNRKPYSLDNYRNIKEQSLGRNDRSNNYYKDQSSRPYNEERGARHDGSYNRSRNDQDQYNTRNRKLGEYYHNDRQGRLSEVDSRSPYQRERSVGRTNSFEDRQGRSHSVARNVDRTQRDNAARTTNTLSVKPQAGRSFTIDTSIDSTFQNFMKNIKEKSIFNQLFDRKTRASSVGRTFVREISVGRISLHPSDSLDNAEKNTDRFRRARSVVRDTRESKSFSEIKADFESYRSKENIEIKKKDLLSRKTSDRSSPRVSKSNNKDFRPRNTHETKSQYSPRKNNRDPRLNRVFNRDPRIKQKEDRYKNDARDQKKYGIIYSNDNIASGTILGSGYGVKNYKIPKIKRAEEIKHVTQTTEKSDTVRSKQEKTFVKGEKTDEIKKKDKEVKCGKISMREEKVKPSDVAPDKKGRNSSKRAENNEEANISSDDIKAKPRRSRRRIKDSDSESEESVKNNDRQNTSVIEEPQSKSIEKDVLSNKDQPCKFLSENKVVSNKDQAHKSLTEKEESIHKDGVPSTEKVASQKDQGDNSFDSSFGIDDMELFSDNIVSDPVIDNINSLIAGLDKDLKSSKHMSQSTGKFSNEITLVNMLENITPQTATEVSKETDDSASHEINKFIGKDDNSKISSDATVTNETTEEQVAIGLEISREVNLTKQLNENEEILTNITIDSKVLIDEKSGFIDKDINETEPKDTQVPIHEKTGNVKNKLIDDQDVAINTSKTNENNQIFREKTGTVVSTTEKGLSANELHNSDQRNARSTTPDSTNTDDIQKETVRVGSLPDSTDEVHTEVSSSDTSASLSSNYPESSSHKEGSTISDPLGNILSILQSKSKLKELLSMLGDQENEKIKKKLEKISEIVSDEEDIRNDLAQDSTMGIDQESCDGREMECTKNDDTESRECTQNLTKDSPIESEDNRAGNDINETGSINNVEIEESKSGSVRVTKKNKTVKKCPTKKGKITKKRHSNSLDKVSGDEKRVTRSDVQKSVQTRKKVSRELLKLQEDIKEMFISDDVLNVTGIRMCRLAKLVDENRQKDTFSKNDTEPVVVIEKINKNETIEEATETKAGKKVTGIIARKKPGPKSKVRIDNSGNADEKSEKQKTIPKYKPGPKSKTKSVKTTGDIDPYDFETDSINESTTSKMSEGSGQESSDSESESLTSLTSFGSSEALSELKPLSELKKKPKRKRSSWKSGVIKPKNKKRKTDQKVETVTKIQPINETTQITIPDFNCFIDRNYCYMKNVFSYSCRLCEYTGEEIVAHYKKEHPHTEIPLSRLSPDVAEEAIEQCEEINFQAISKIPTDKYVCRFCYKEFGKRKAALESFFWHVVSMHTGEYKQICSECVNITRCPFNLDIPPPPKDIKGQLIGYICGKCNFTQISLENLKTHVIVRHNDEQTEVYTINLAIMSRKIINLLSKRTSVPGTDKPRVLRSSRSNQSMAEMSDDRSDATESLSFVTEPEAIKNENDFIEKKEKRKLSSENKSKLQSKITFESDDTASESSNKATSAFASQMPVKVERDDVEEQNRAEATYCGSIEVNSAILNQSGEVAVPEGITRSHFEVKYADGGTRLVLTCFINGLDCRYTCSSIKALRTHVTIKHKDQKWDGYCFDCKDFITTRGKYIFKDFITHFHENHLDNSRQFENIVSDIRFNMTCSETEIKQYICYIEGHDYYQSPTLDNLKLQISAHKGKWDGYCVDCKEFVKPQGEYLIQDCLSHFMVEHNINDSPESTPGIEGETLPCNQAEDNPAASDIFPYSHFKVTYTDTGNKEFVCCINKMKGVHYKTPLLISLKRHVQTRHSENWDGYCFMCKVIVVPQGLHLFKDCLQHYLDKHMDDFPELEKEPEPENSVEESEKPDETPAPPTARPYINVRPLSQLTNIDADEGGLILPKIESVVSLGATPAPAAEFSGPPEEEANQADPPVPEPELQIDEFHNYEASQIKVMKQKHPVVQEAMLRKEKLVRVFKCAGSYCSFATDSADMALSHALTHQKIGGENALCCSYCDFDCSGNAIDLVVHVFKHASCPFSCGHCFYRAAAAQLVVAHSNTAHVGKQVKVYIANNATIPEKDTAKMLSREVVVQYYVCNHVEYDQGPRCKFKTYTARKFCDHLQARHAGLIHSCYICSQTLPSAADLIQHMKSHDLNLYQCTWCVHGADSEADLLAHAATRHPAQQPQAYLRIITNKDGSSEMRVLPLASFNRSSIGVEHVTCSSLPENPVKEAERSIDLQKLIGQTKLMFESITASTEKPDEPAAEPVETHEMTVNSPMPTPNQTPPRTSTPHITEQPTPVPKAEPVEATPSKVSDEVVCLDSDEEISSDRSESANVIDISKDGDEDKSKTDNTINDEQVFKCPKCLVCYKTDTGLKLHILKCYNPEWAMACPHCHKMTQNREALVQHYIADHCMKYVCSYCNRENHSLKSAKSHMKWAHKVNKITVTRGPGKNQHVVQKDTATAGPARSAPKRKLSMSNVQAPQAKQMKRYGPQDIEQLPINPILDDLVYCTLCEFNTKVRLNMVRHLQLHAEQQPVPQTAPVNPVPHLETNEMHFDKMVNLASSSLAKEKTKEVGPLISQIPPEAAARYPKYVPERQRYTCGAKDCSYTSVDEAMLRCHWETLHSGTTDYRCVHCPPYQHLDKSKPLIAGRIIMHLKMHDTSLYACSSCTYYYFRKQVVEKHINDAHKGNGQVMVVREEATGPVVLATSGSAPTMDLKPWQCGLCQFKSMLRPEVAEHCSKNHQSKMQFKCAYCPFRTSTLENVVKHQTNSHPGRPEEIFYFYYREGSVPDEDGTPKWMKQRQKMGITEDPVVKTEASEGLAAKSDAPLTVTTTMPVDLNIVKKEVEERCPDGELSMEDLCRKFGEFCEPNGLRYKCSLCSVVTEDTKEAMQSHLYEELQYRKWRCSICSYKAFHKNGLHDHIATEHRGRIQEPLPINLPVDENIERWVAELLRHQTTIIERNKHNLLVQKVQTPGPSGLNAPQKVPEKPVETPKINFNGQELEEAFGTFGAGNSKEFCCPKCAFKTEKEDLMREHLEMELTKIRWCCSHCSDNFQTYHEALTHCRGTHEGQWARPREALRDPQVRGAWVRTAIETQKKNITVKNVDCLTNRSDGVAIKQVETPQDDGPRLKFSMKVLEQAFGQFGVANNKQFCCPKCIYRSKNEDAVKEHLETELNKIRWSCSHCPEKFQTYHEAQFHCKIHAGMSARPTEAPRDPDMRSSWVAAVVQVQKLGMKAAVNENLHFSPNKNSPSDPEDSLLVVRYEEKVPIPETSTSRPISVPPSPRNSPEPHSDDEKLIIDETFAPHKVGKMSVCPHCPYQSKHLKVVKDHVYRHYGLYPNVCGYCEYTGYRANVSAHLETVHPHEVKKIKATPLPKGRPIVKDIKVRVRRKNTGEWRFCLLCQSTFTAENATTHSHGDTPVVFVKHGDIVVNCKVCQTFRKDAESMEEHYASAHPDKPRNYFVFQIVYHPTNGETTTPTFKRIPRLPSETININDDDAPPPKKVARKSTTKLPMQTVAKKSTTKLPLLYISEDEEYSFYGTKPPPLDSFENVTTLMPFCNTMMPFTVKKLSEILKINPVVLVKDIKQ